MRGCILVPLDGSPVANRALSHASALARARAYPVLLLRVLTPEPRRGEELLQEPEARAELQRIADRLRACDVSASVQISTTLLGSPAEVIVDTAQREGAQIIVMSTHGRTGLGRWLYGSVAEQVLRLAPIPVLLVPAISNRVWPTDHPPRVLLTLDGSDAAARAIAPVTEWARALSAEVTLVRVQPSSGAEAAAYMYEDRPAEQREAVQSLETAAAHLRHAGIHATLSTPTGHPAQCIAEVARERDVDIIAMATHGRSGVSRVVLGSVATETLQRAAVPMLLIGVKPPSAASPDRLQQSETAQRRPMTLLVPLDLTDKADAVLPEVSTIASACDADVILLNVYLPIVELGRVVTESREEGLAYLTTERRMFLERKAEELRGLRVTVRVEALPHGEELDGAIARVADECKATMVVLATGRLSSTAGVLLGSVAQGVLARSPCPVTIVRYEPRRAAPAGASSGPSSDTQRSVTSPSAQGQPG
jgi:nucleotide-binding universal stress UspA family protein